MIRDKTIEGSFLNIALDPRPFPLRTADDNAAFPRRPATMQARLVTLRFEMKDKNVTEIRAELVLDPADFAKAEAANHFGLETEPRTVSMTAKDFSQFAPIHVLASADMERIGPYQFEGLDLMNNQNDLLEALMSATHDSPGSAFHEFETWKFESVQQKTSPESEPVGFDRVP